MRVLRALAAGTAMLVGLITVTLTTAGSAPAATLAIEAETVFTVSGPAVENGLVIVEDGRITFAGEAGAAPVPVDAVRLTARVVTPGLIDAHSSVGLAGLYNVSADQDQDEVSGPNQAHLRALDGFNPAEPLLRYLLEHGVTLIQSGPGTANPIAGQMGIFRTHGTSADRMTVRFPSAMLFNLGEAPKETYGSKQQFPSTRMGTAAVIREALQSSLDGDREKSGETSGRNLKEEALRPVVRGELPAVFMANREDDILTALRIAREFDLRAILSGAAEGYLVTREIREAGMPVLVGPVMQRVRSPETLNATYENSYFLSRAAIPVAIRSGNEGYVPKTRLVLFEAAIAAANGLGPEGALRAITLDAARILGVDGDYGSIEEGKIADLVLFDGDPFEYASHVEAVILGGEIVHRR
jgi:imidazolonepropionase-like amidohydrolase